MAANKVMICLVMKDVCSRLCKLDRITILLLTESALGLCLMDQSVRQMPLKQRVSSKLTKHLKPKCRLCRLVVHASWLHFYTRLLMFILWFSFLFTLCSMRIFIYTVQWLQAIFGCSRDCDVTALRSTPTLITSTFKPLELPANFVYSDSQ